MLRVAGLWKEYDGVVAVRDLTLEIAEGEIFGLIGPNGAGKTTLLRICCGLLDPTAGQVSVAGVDVLRAPREAQAQIGYLSDFFSLYDDLRVWEYLDYFARSYNVAPEVLNARVAEVLHEIGLESKREAMIKGLS
ncbi:MAG: ABC transporter ATP-binding protein, partial [Acidobacteriales bacterium]|nr:ABC transporter ATP-binding protein [Terriglobales bacterium]